MNQAHTTMPFRARYAACHRALRRLAFCAVLCALSGSAAGFDEWTGMVAAEYRIFQHTPPAEGQHGNNLSLVAQPEYYREWDDGRRSFTFVPFLRYDGHDSERTHFDIRELNWVHVGEHWELRYGIGKVFWGVTESQHLVDIVNQTDAVENIDGEDKLGQPMVNLTLITDWGDINLFALPGFRKRTFPGEEGRLRGPFVVDGDDARYASGRKQHRIDFALRYTRSAGGWDLGISHFSGTSRDPRFIAELDGNGQVVLVPFYDVIDQTGLDLQYTTDAWLWKLEAISRSGQGRRYSAVTGGFEYTLTGAFGSRADLGLLAEYLYDDRSGNALTPFEDDLFLGMRLALNDVQSTEALIGTIIDMSSGAQVFSLEASRRLGEHWKLNIESRLFSDIPDEDLLLVGLRNDDFVQVELAYHF